MFFEFRQNNSGGSFDYDANRGIAHFVIIEADDVKEANCLAERIGLYFDGCSSGIDCNCCGDRWFEQWSEQKGSEKPSIYEEIVEPEQPFVKKDVLSWKWMKEDEYEGFIHYKDKTFKGFWK